MRETLSQIYLGVLEKRGNSQFRVLMEMHSLGGACTKKMRETPKFILVSAYMCMGYLDVDGKTKNLSHTLGYVNRILTGVRQ